ncbi:DUF4169 family protein [Sphingobium scionense]|uniref:DUF4169 domain-containing protein n=1 Tax=Sphingobium scionense TaxID=1404341 RepID=A0A7W6LPV4_9SPHN|nr:DUF4169 family protein [Sphingobium scionense]MBB4148314.1 hypothetical protein [Sphingobium scionense]
MSNVINFRLARKARDRADKAQAADSNRAKFGRTKAQKLADEKEARRKASLLDGSRLENKDKSDGDA